MFRKLLIVFASGLVLSVVAFGLAWVVGGEKLRTDIARGEGVHWNIDLDDEEDAKVAGPSTTRSFAIASGQRLVMEVPADLDFVRGDKPQMMVEGPASIVSKLVWENGRLSLPDGSVDLKHGLKVRIVAPEIAGLDFDAPGEVSMAGLDQDAFELNATGAMNFEAEGKVRRLDVSSEGASNIDFGKVQSEDARIRMDGVGNVKIAATGNVDVELNGAGAVTLKRKPRTLTSEINGIGAVNHDY